LSINAPEQMPEVVLQLAGLMRYQLDNSRLATVTVGTESEYLVNYVGLEKLRLRANTQVEFVADLPQPQQRIVPQPLLPLLENYFKHAIGPAGANDIRISLTQQEGVLTLRTDNSIPVEFRPAASGLPALRTIPIEVLFLDANVPGLTGLDMLRALLQPPAVVLCTAHAIYALDSFELGVADYLLKPIRFERFVKTINRLYPLRYLASPAPVASPGVESLFLKTDAGTERVRLAELQFVEGYGNFVKCRLASGCVLLTAETMKQLELQLTASQFIRIHKSYLVNLAYIERLSGNSLLVGTHKPPHR
jgi:two-component system LytT family response regulator